MTVPTAPAPATPGPRGPRSKPSGVQLPPPVRKTMVVLHVISSVSWLALMLCVLAMSTTALLTDDADTVRALYRAMPVLGDTLILPLSLLSVLTGLALSLGTPWRIFKYRWITVKFWLSLAAAAASIFQLTARLHEAAHLAVTHPTGPVSAMHLGFVRYNLVIVPTIALTVYVINVWLSVFKPWGLRPRWVAKNRRS
ncbi:DUF2269 domain-containing protein [Kitasatospora viridis]|uniref:DUF2269 domain-containing protein n=1 Tax=Kitasatospora viridis TaxID=281105 RepID=A0A561UCF5_9ACTN|nr:DUF2269 domain-containing protein [Kitasatospora viridis]TWF97030.1 hypothetical protein FHX73_11805 [Kitasatospora viridis]